VHLGCTTAAVCFTQCLMQQLGQQPQGLVAEQWTKGDDRARQKDKPYTLQ
jgi:hypothetical protein